jgi:hypothetical protein
VKNADAALARINKVKNFPQNIEVAADLYTTDKRTGYASLMTVHYSLSAIPETSYRPRLADDRIGYFLTAIKDYSGSPRDETRYVRYVNRWNLAKADPSLDVSPPAKPIVFYLDKNIPVRYRRYVREGILEWNRAFEKLGIVDALVVRQQTDSNEFAAFDPEDVRYNFFRWVTTDNAFAMGPSRANPRTGEILDADIIFDDSLIRWLMSDYDILLEEGFTAKLPPELQRHLETHPEQHPGRFLRERRVAREAQAAASVSRLHGPGPADDPYRMSGPLDPAILHSRGFCTMGRGLSHQMTLAALATATLAAAGDDTTAAAGWPEELVGQFVKQIVMHEVGHTLGLRHNFKASTWRELDSLAKPAGAEQTAAPVADLAGSVMDYIALNIELDRDRQGNYVNTTLGPYDLWAIEYGYSVVDAPTPEAERPALDAIASRVAEPELRYGTDEDVWTSDPLVNVWDLGSDPLDFAASRMALIDTLKVDLVARAVPEGDSYARLRKALDALLYEHAYVAQLAASYVGGTYIHRDHRGDPGDRDPLEPVDVAKQRQALAFVADHVFAKDAFELPPELLRKLTAGRWWHWGSTDPFQDPDYELHDRILTTQLWALFQLLNPVTQRRIHDAEMRVPPGDDAMTLPELYATLTGRIFSEVADGPQGGRRYTNRRPLVSSLRRNLQREYIASLTWVTLREQSGYPRVARTLAWDHLRRLGDSIDALLESGMTIDDYSAAHLRECRTRIRKAVEAEYTIQG